MKLFGGKKSGAQKSDEKSDKNYAEISRETSKDSKTRDENFAYLSDEDSYFDSACQSLRPKSVLDEMRNYYEKFNSCGERVKYKWGQEVDSRIEDARAKTLSILKLSAKDFFVSFTLNTTYGINLILSQIKFGEFRKIFTSNIEHNSVFLPTISFAEKHKIPREVLTRNSDGSINLTDVNFENSLVVLNVASNIDGRKLENLAEISRKIHAENGCLILDAAQATAFYHGWLADEISRLKPAEKPDAICFSSHKMYGPSLGIIVCRRDFLAKIDANFVGGGMVDDVSRDDFTLSARNSEHIHTIFEAGLQPYAEICGYLAALDFLLSRKKADYVNIENFAKDIFNFLTNSPKIHLLNEKPTTTISFFAENLDSHLLAEALSDEKIMARSGYFCCHYFLAHEKNYPPLLRISLGFHNSAQDVEKLIKTFSKIF